MLTFAIEVVSVDWACETLGCSRAQVFRLLKAGKLERAPRFGRRLRIYRASVDALLRPQVESRRQSRRRRAPSMGDRIRSLPLQAMESEA